MVPAEILPRPFGPYLLQHRLAIGGMAEVYVATSTGSSGAEKRVALKVIHPKYSADRSFVSMLIEEAKLSVMLNHQNIVQTFDLGCIDGTYFIVMEFVDGCDAYHLLQTIRSRGLRLPIDLGVYIALEVARGLDYAHRRADEFGRPLDVVHRDVSPQNVLLSRAGEIKIADFGIAKAAYRAEETDAGVIKGKYFYMSPEQAWGDPLDRRSDVFSLGILLWELLVGERVHQDKELEPLLRAVRAAQVPVPSAARADIPTVLNEIVARATAEHREDRYASAGGVAEALSQYLATCAPAYRGGELSKWVESAGRPPAQPRGGGADIPITHDHAGSSISTRRRRNAEPEDFRLAEGSVIFHTIDEQGTPGTNTQVEFDAREHVETVHNRPTVPSRPPIEKPQSEPSTSWLLAAVAFLALTAIVYLAFVLP